MAREFAINLYLTLFRMAFMTFKLFPLREKTTFVASFGGNVTETVHELEKQIAEHRIVMLQTSKQDVQIDSRHRVLRFVMRNPWHFLRGIYHLATSKHVIVDNYYGFLAVTDFDEGVSCTQLWHANGAIKQFGLEDKSNAHRSERALDRFQAVYNRFDQVIVGSERMKEIFKKSFGLPEERFIRSGIPRTDFFFDERAKTEAMEMLKTDFPSLQNKKMILYAPTYRDGQFSQTALALDIAKMQEQLAEDYVLFLRLHPAVTAQLDNDFPNFVYDVSNYPSINTLLVGANILVTDYSSIPFEYCLLDRPMIFYAYDYDVYAKDRGVWSDYEARVPGNVAQTTDDIVQMIVQEDFALEKVQPFAAEWNMYSNGTSSKSVIEALYHDELFDTEKEIRELG